MQSLRIAVIGAGLSGAVVARRLVDAGHEPTVFEKSRGAGGRMASRRVEETLAFDHGAQYFTARDERFVDQVRQWQATGDVARWDGRIGTLERGTLTFRDEPEPGERWVGVPGMNAPAKRLLAGIELRTQTRIGSLERRGDRWALRDSDGHDLGLFDFVVSSCPPEQTSAIFGERFAYETALSGVRFHPCWAGLVAFETPLSVPVDGAFVRDSPLSWCLRNGSKPARNAAPDAWVLHASGEWSAANLERSPEDVLAELLAAFETAVGETLPRIAFSAAHRWRYALPPEPADARRFWDGAARLGACGDWCGGPRVEGAWLSGQALAEAILAAT